MARLALALLLAAVCGAPRAQAPGADGARIPSLPEAAFARIDNVVLQLALKHILVDWPAGNPKLQMRHAIGFVMVQHLEQAVDV